MHPLHTCTIKFILAMYEHSSFPHALMHPFCKCNLHNIFSSLPYMYNVYYSFYTLSCILSILTCTIEHCMFTLAIHEYYSFLYAHMHPFYKCTMHNAHCTMHIELLIFLYKHNTVARSKSFILDKNAHSSFLRS